jgi:hypothetical protein
VRRFVFLLCVVAAVSGSGCAVGAPQPPTSPSDFGDSIVLNAKVNSSIDGPTDYWFRYGERGEQANWSETPHQTAEITDGQPESVSAELTGLEPSHRYGWQVCVADREEDPPRVVCSTERKFGTVGDAVISVNREYDAVSGPDGENPSGTMGEHPVTCLRVQGSEVAVVGIDQGVYHFKLHDNPSPPLYHVEFVAWPEGSDHTICPQPKEPEGPSFVNRLFVQDAP